MADTTDVTTSGSNTNETTATGADTSSQPDAAAGGGVATGSSNTTTSTDLVNALIQEPTADPTGLSQQDIAFAQQAALSGLAEVAEGRLAMDMADTPLIRVYGHWMVANHDAVNQVLTNLADKLGIALPTELDAAHQAGLAALSEQEGAAFDQAYASMQVEDHQAAVDLFQAEVTSGTNPALKSLAQQVLPTLQTHLQQAQVIAGTGDTTGDASSAAVTPVQIPPDTASATVTATAATSGADDATGGALGQDASFVQKAAADGLLEISEGNLMVQRIGTDNSVGEFGLWMASDHAALSATLKALAAAEGIAVPTSLPADLQQDVTALGSVSEQDLPGTYMTWQVIGHADSVMQFLDEAENGQSAVLQAFAQNALPILGHHLQEAAELYREHGGQLSDIGMNDTQLSDLIRAALGDDQAGLAADMTSGSAWVDATSMPDQAAAQSDQGAFFPTSLGASMNPADVMALQNA